MHIPITRYGLPQVVVFPAVITALMAALFIFLPRNGLLAAAFAAAEIILFLILVWALMFFRNPQRVISHDEYTLLSPADGTVTEISETESPELGGKALRIGIFLSIFNVHVNRTPCSARIESVTYKKGKFKNAMSGEAGKINESNSIVMTRLSRPHDKIMVRQVSGAIARRIVCKAVPGREYTQGAVFGMIKFGSRTELLIPLRGTAREGGYDISVKIGDKVNAGLSPLIVYRQ
jgi:phosphatidylserine decarboxylase